MTIGFLVSRMAPNTRIVIKDRNAHYAVREDATAAELGKREGKDALLSTVTDCWGFIEDCKDGRSHLHITI